MSNIVEKLRDQAGSHRSQAANLVREAADEIERLRTALQRIADMDVEDDLKTPDVLAGIAWAALDKGLLGR